MLKVNSFFHEKQFQLGSILVLLNGCENILQVIHISVKVVGMKQILLQHG